MEDAAFQGSWYSPPPWLSFAPYAVLARLALSLASAAHGRAVEQAEGVFHQLKEGEVATASTLVKSAALRMAPAFWLSAGLCVAAEIGLGVAIVLGGAIALPLLAASGALLDGFARWAFLHDPPPRRRALVGGGLAVMAAVLATHFAPPPASLPGEELWDAMQRLPALTALGLLSLSIVMAEALAAAHVLRVARELAALLAAEAALFGALGALCIAALGSCLRFELRQHRHEIFSSPCVFQLSGLTAGALYMQARRLRTAYGMGERAAVCRVHGATLILTAPAAIAALFASVGEAGGEPNGFTSWFDIAGFVLTVALSVLSLALVHRPRNQRSLGAPRLDMDPQLAAFLGSATPQPPQPQQQQQQQTATTRSSAASLVSSARSSKAAEWASVRSPTPPDQLGRSTPSDGGAEVAYEQPAEAISYSAWAERRGKKPVKTRKAHMTPTEWTASLTYLIPQSPKAPSFRPSAPLKAFTVATAHPDGHDPLPGRAETLGPANGHSTLAQLANEKWQASGALQAVAAAEARLLAHTKGSTTVGHSPRCRQVLASHAAYKSSPPPHRSPGSPELVPSFVRGHPAASEVQTLWGFTGQLRAQGVRSAASWPPPRSPSPEPPPPKPPDDGKKKRDELALAIAGATAVLGEELVASLRWYLILALGAPCLMTPIGWWVVSGMTMRSDEFALISLTCVCAASAVHDTLLMLTLAIFTCGRGEAARRAADAAARAEDSDDEFDDPKPGDANEVLQSRFVHRDADMQLEARLKSEPKLPAGLPLLADAQRLEGLNQSSPVVSRAASVKRRGSEPETTWWGEQTNARYGA